MQKHFTAQPASADIFWKKGFITLAAVLLIGAAGLAIAVSLLLLGLGFSRSSFAIEQQNLAKALASACAERGLEMIRDNPAFSGTGSFNLDDGSCVYTVTKQAGENRTLNAYGSVGSIIRKTKVTLDKITPQINITSWQEVADF